MLPRLITLLALSLVFTSAFAQGDMEKIPSTQKKLDARMDAAKEQFPPEALQMMHEGVLVAKEAEKTAINVGDTAPDFTLPDATGNMVTLSELLKDGPVVITWYRGNWCPFCNIALHDLGQLEDRFTEAGAQLVAISPQLPDSSLSIKEKHDLDMHVLSDLHNKVAHKYGIVYKLIDPLQPMYRDKVGIKAYNGDESFELPMAVTYVIDQDGTVTWAFIDGDYTKRAEPKDVLAAVRALDSKE